MIVHSIRNFFMRFMVWNMRWMTRYSGFVAHTIVKFYGDNEIIACGFRDKNNKVMIIYTPGRNHRNHMLMVFRDHTWIPAALQPTKSFSGSVVLCVAVPDAQNGMLCKMRGIKTSGSSIKSPTIMVKPKTIYDPSLLEIQKIEEGSALFNWKEAEKYDPMIYFFAVEDASGANTLAAVYTRECFWKYPITKMASYSVGPIDPPKLDLGHQYVAKLILVDYDGWVSHIAEKKLPMSHTM